MAFQFGYPGYNYNPGNTYIPQQQMPTPMQQPQPMAQAFACHPVTSREEAVAAQTDYFSAGLVMPDLGHGTIYLKRFNPQTGASDFFEFRAVQEEKAEEPVQYVTMEEFEKFKSQLKKGERKITKEVVEEYE